LSKDRSTGPLPGEILDPREEEDRQEEGDEAHVSGHDDDEDALDTRVELPMPAPGAVAAAHGPGAAQRKWSPLGFGAAPGTPAAGGTAPAPQSPAEVQHGGAPLADRTPGSRSYVSDEQFARNMLAGYPDDILVDIIIQRVENGQARDVGGGVLHNVIGSVARDAGNFIDVSGDWVVDYRSSRTGKPVSKAKYIHTEGAPYYEGWKPRILGGDMADDPRTLRAIAEFMKALGAQPPTAFIQPGQPGQPGVPQVAYNDVTTALREEIRDLKTDRGNLLVKLEIKDKEIRELEKRIGGLEMDVRMAKLENKGDGGSKTSETAQLITAIGTLVPKHDTSKDDILRGLIETERAHSSDMLKLALGGRSDANAEKVAATWGSLFDGAQRLAKAGQASETAELIKGLAPLGIEWVKGQQTMALEQMRVRAGQQGQQQQQQQAQAQGAAQAQQQPDQVALKHALFHAQMGMVIHRARTGAPADDLGAELAQAVKMCRYQELATGNPDDEKMLRDLETNPDESLPTLGRIAGVSEEYIARLAVVYREKMGMAAAGAGLPPQPPAAASPPATQPVAAPKPPEAGPPAPATPPRIEPPHESKPMASAGGGPGNGEGQKAELENIPQGAGGPHVGGKDGPAPATGGVQGADHPDVAGQTS